MIQSPCTITLTPSGGPAIVLLAAGGWIEDLPTFEASQDLFEVDGIGLSNGFFRPLGAVTVSFQLSVESDHANLLSALEANLDADVAGAASLVQISGSLLFVEFGVSFASAVVTAITPSLPTGPTSTVIRTITIKTSLPN